jgi:hypothetical protein
LTRDENFAVTAGFELMEASCRNLTGSWQVRLEVNISLPSRPEFFFFFLNISLYFTCKIPPFWNPN